MPARSLPRIPPPPRERSRRRSGRSDAVGAPPSRAVVTLRTVWLAIMIGYAIVRLTNADYWDPLDDLNLAVHEAGHLFLGVFGETIGILGGSLVQVLVPAAFVAYFARTRQAYASGVVLSWVGVNLLNVARYIGDARARELPLLGGEDSIHDWGALLDDWQLLAHDTQIARFVTGAAVLAFALGAIIAMRTRRS
jgi:hypothetical protein